MIRFFQTERGDFAPAELLSPAEALAAHRAQDLRLAEVLQMKPAARDAVGRSVARKVRGMGRGRVVFVMGGVW